MEVASRRLLGELIICRNISAARPREGRGAADPHTRLKTNSMCTEQGFNRWAAERLAYKAFQNNVPETTLFLT